MKQLLVVVSVLSILIISGCASDLNPRDIARAHPVVKQFLQEHPNAEILLTHFTENQSVNIIEDVREDCNNPYIEPTRLYKVTVTDEVEELSVLAWLDWETKTVLCAMIESTNPCKGVTCQDSVEVCQDGYYAACPNTCSDGVCSACEPDCSGHGDPCEGVSCSDSVKTCPDGYEASCPNTCSGGECSSCEPDCTGHTDLCEGKSCNDDNPCTADSCVEGECQHENKEEGTECADNKECQSGVCKCVPHSSYSCYSGDVYWYDSCGAKEEKKEACEIGCENNTCIIIEEPNPTILVSNLVSSEEFDISKSGSDELDYGDMINSLWGEITSSEMPLLLASGVIHGDYYAPGINTYSYTQKIIIGSRQLKGGIHPYLDVGAYYPYPFDVPFYSTKIEFDPPINFSGIHDDTINLFGSDCVLDAAYSYNGELYDPHLVIRANIFEVTVNQGEAPKTIEIDGSEHNISLIGAGIKESGDLFAVIYFDLGSRALDNTTFGLMSGGYTSIKVKEVSPDLLSVTLIIAPTESRYDLTGGEFGQTGTGGNQIYNAEVSMEESDNAISSISIHITGINSYSIQEDEDVSVYSNKVEHTLSLIEVLNTTHATISVDGSTRIVEKDESLILNNLDLTIYGVYNNPPYSLEHIRIEVNNDDKIRLYSDQHFTDPLWENFKIGYSE
jgi:hypothetical protein